VNFLIDYNLTGDAVLFWETLSAEGWLDLLSIRFFTFSGVGLPMDSSDRAGISPLASARHLAIRSNQPNDPDYSKSKYEGRRFSGTDNA
jgi:hypothetical protein